MKKEKKSQATVEVQQNKHENIEEQAESMVQYVTFFLNDEAFAFPMVEVKEIVRIPESVKVPMTSHCLVGLANLRGTVLPILDLRRILSVEEQEHTDATRVMVTDCKGSPVGLIVDRVARVISVEKDSIESAEAIRNTINADLIDGVVKNVDDYDIIQLLGAEKTINEEFSHIIKNSLTAGQNIEAQAASELDESEEDDATQLVSFMVDQQEYAFDIQQVEEIVRIPSTISRIPKTGVHVIGIINLRNSLLPLVNLRTMFHLPVEELNDHNRIIVVSISGGSGKPRQSVGIVVDHVREVLRISNDAIDALPTLLSERNEASDITGICRMDSGKRLVSILSSDVLFDSPIIQDALATAEQHDAGDSLDVHTIDEEDHTESEETQLVAFHLGGQEFGISIDSVQEITRVPTEMNRVPKTAEFIEGMVNLRGAVLPVMDMRSRFGMEKIERSDRQRILVLDLNGTPTGFITDAVAEVIRLSKKLIEDAPQLSEEQSKIMGKVVNLKDQNRMIQVLNASELLQKSELKELSKSA